MSIFGPKCLHSWEVRARTVAKPVRAVNIEGRGPEVLEAYQLATHGFSVVLLTCSKCGKVEQRTLLGEVAS